jgi:hypothetical protein
LEGNQQTGDERAGAELPYLSEGNQHTGGERARAELPYPSEGNQRTGGKRARAGDVSPYRTVSDWVLREKEAELP